jgi:Ca2+-binding EF-hand superfamily protein
MMPRSLRSSTLIALSIPIALSAGIQPAAAQPTGTEDERRRVIFRELDVDADGRISRSEFELRKVAVIYRDVKDRTPKLRIEDTRFSQKTFNSFDIDKTGVLDIRDVMAAPPFQFAYWDRNEDGAIDWSELNAGLDDLQR